MSIDARLVDTFRRSLVLLAPAVADLPLAFHARRRNVKGDFALFQSIVQKTDRNGAVRERTRPDIVPAPVHDARRRLSERILVNCNHFVVPEKREREVVQLRHVAADHKGSCRERPERYVRVLFVGGETASLELVPAHGPYAEHVGVVPSARLRVTPLRLENLYCIRDGRPPVEHVACRAPALSADLYAPGAHVVIPVLAEREQDVAVLRLERIAHDAIRTHGAFHAFAGSNLPVGAPVVLQVVKAPFGIGLCILRLVLPAAFASSACLWPRRRIDPGLEPLGVDVVDEPLHVRKALVRVDLSILVPHRTLEFLHPRRWLVLPEVVDVDVGPTMLGKPGLLERISRFADIVGGHIPGEAVPAVPAHRGGKRYLVADLDREVAAIAPLAVLRRKGYLVFARLLYGTGEDMRVRIERQAGRAARSVIAPYRFNLQL